jgi:hypothetical protein
MFGAYKPVAEFIKLSRKLDFAPTFVIISFVGSDQLATEHQGRRHVRKGRSGRDRARRLTPTRRAVNAARPTASDRSPERHEDALHYQNHVR